MIHLQTMRSFSLLLLLLLPLAAGVQAAAPPPAPAPPAPPPAAPAGPPAAGSILAPPDWSTELVDSTRTTGKYASLALDAAGHPHVSYSYYYNNDYDLRYAYHDGTDWITTTVDSTGNVGAYSSLALDAAGHPHISYRDSGNFDLKYAYHDGTNWISMTVDSTGTVGLYTSIALDDAGHPHISYRDNTHTCLKYAYHDGSAWHLVQNPVPNAGLYTSIALDAAGHPHISHVDGNASLHYTYYDGTWHDDNPVEDNVQYHTSLALDSTGAPHISYYDSANADLGYATFVGAGGTCMNTAWQCDTIDETADVGRYSSLALDSLDRPRISYCEYLSGPAACDKLKYAYYVGAGGGMDCTDSDWTCQTVDGIDPLIPAGAYSSLALGRDNRPHIAYFVAGADNDLYYAYDRNCLPLSGVELTGPTFLLVNQTGAYTASESPPPTATLPLAFSWQDGATGPTAAYSWTQPGLYTVAATLSNPCSTVTHALTVTVCQPVNSGAITGPAFLLTNQSAAYTLTYGPANASLPVSYLWDNGSTGPSAVYSWTLPGTYTLTVTIANPCGQVQASYVVQVCQPVNSALIDGPAFLLT
ncbi:MAG: PKD domain-containing protein, partial [Chloroflexia bacterium]|nr:PKD domain-containing protein [Chloroflexia bacterium]